MKKIALLSDGWKRLVTYSWMDGITGRIKELGLDICLDQYNTNGNWSLDEKYNTGEYSLYSLPDLKVYDGIIFDCSNMTDKKQIDRIVQYLKSLSVPVVSISYAVDGFYYVGNDNKALFRNVIDHMVRVHHSKSFAFAGGPIDNYENQMRYEAFEEAMDAYGIKVPKDHIMFGDFDFLTGERYFEEWLQSGKAFPDVFICANDNIAAGLCSAAMRHDYEIPKDFCVTGFDNLDKAAYFKPQITTVEHNRGNIGKTAVQVLVDLWDGKKVPEYSYLYSECIPGESCGCPNSGRIDYRIYIKWMIEASVHKDHNDEEVMILERNLKDCNSFQVLFSSFANYIENLGCDGVYLYADHALLEASIEPDFRTDGYELSRMKYVYGCENKKEVPAFENYESFRAYLDEQGSGNAYLYSSLHFRDEIVGFIVLKNPVFLYDNPCFYDILSVFSVTLESLFKQIRLEKMNEKLREIYNKDPLTGLYNRVAYQEMILPRFEKYQEMNQNCAMIFFDVDEFKKLNDTYGHAHGDHVLKQIAGILTKNKPDDGLAYRFGGDEFVVFFPIDQDGKLEAFVEQITKEFEANHLRVSLGVILTKPEEKKTLDEYLVQADIEMYQVKQKRHEDVRLLKEENCMDNETPVAEDKEASGNETITSEDETESCKEYGSFLKGFDISSLPQFLDHEEVFYDEDGTCIDAFQLLKKNQVNWVRLRIWNDPENVPEAQGYCDLSHTLEMAKKIKKNHMKFFLDFHYSDYWADPGQQRKPKSWENLPFDELVFAVYSYTREVLVALQEQGCLPDMVQVGNEIRSGMLFPDGEVPNYKKLAVLVNAGIMAVRDVSSKIKVMIHLDQGGRFFYLQEWFDAMFAAGMEKIDAIGISFYSFWHGTFMDLGDSMRQLIERYHLPVYVVETAHPWRHCEGEHITFEQMKTAGLPAGIEEQKRALEYVMQIASETSGKWETGVFYWEPLCFPKKGYGSWNENMGMLDETGKALPAFHAFRDFVPGKKTLKEVWEEVSKLYVVEEKDLPPKGTNLLNNPQFLDDFKSWWVSKNEEQMECVVRTIENENENEIYIAGKMNFHYDLSQEIYLHEEGEYTFSLDFRGTNTTGVSVKMFMKQISCNKEERFEKEIFPSDVSFVNCMLERIPLQSGSVQIGIVIDAPPVFARMKNFRLVRSGNYSKSHDSE